MPATPRIRFRVRRGTVVLLGGAGLLLAAAACRDVLKIEDPQSFVDEKLDNPIALAPVANGVEGDFMLAYDDIAVFTGMLSDELQSTSTWIDWDDISEGRIRGDWATAGSFAGPQNDLLRARFSAQEAAARFKRVLKDSADASPLMVQVRVTEAWIDLVLAMAYCESPATAGGPRVPDTEMFKQAISKLTAVLPLIQGARLNDAQRLAWTNYVRAGLARANLMLGNYDAALANAQMVTPGFRKDAIYSDNSPAQYNVEANQGHPNFNRSVGMRTIWLPQVDTLALFLKDPFSGQLDKRVPITFDANNAKRLRLGVNNRTPFIGNGKTPSRSAPIALAKKEEMNLIEAEVYWRRGDLATAIAKLNVNRTAVGLPPLANPGTSDAVFTMLLQERFATLYAEGHRMQDLKRFNLVRERLGPGRATKLPLSRNEILANPSLREGEAACPAVS